MEVYNFKLFRAFQPSFDEAGDEWKQRIFGVDYILLRGMQGGLLFLTRYGWPLADSLRPRHWYVDGRFRETGQRLVGSTGSVFRMELPHRELPGLPVVIKFNRFAQDAPVFYTIASQSEAADKIARGARFLSPFEEFSLLQKLRASHKGHSDRRPIWTQRPLGIYCPATRYPAWKLGRKENTYWRYDRALAADQKDQPEDQRIVHEWDRVYITLFNWVKGVDAQDAAESGAISDETMVELSRSANKELSDRGFRVLDSKPRHIILRPHGRSGRPKKFRGQLPYALIDYELLEEEG